MTKRRIAYYMHNDIGGFYYGSGHAMKPHRISMAHNLTLAYGLHNYMEVYRPRLASHTEFENFHSKEYTSFLRRISPDNVRKLSKELTKFNLGGDCPVFDGLFKFCQMYTGGSIDGARKLMDGTSDISINWSGGLHHAKKGEASGFCYINDIVLAILELLKLFPRVLYIDIDCHHGDGVEEAFYVTDRVMTVSFHQFGNMFFPGTGDIWDTGHGRGEYHAVNVPLKHGISDDNYESIFRPVIAKVMEMYRPSAIVLQCGADSLANDRLGSLNLTIEGHGNCVQFVKRFGIPTLVLGGGGYNVRSVARCWVYETALLLERDIDPNIPFNDYWQYFHPDHQLHFERNACKDSNSRSYLDRLRVKVLENLRNLTFAPSVEIQAVPRSGPEEGDTEREGAHQEEDLDGPYGRGSGSFHDGRVASGEFYDTL